MVVVPILNLRKHFFHNPVLVPVPTSRCQIMSELQEPYLELLVINFQTRYMPNIGQNPGCINDPPNAK
jgi:hypothetical protein